MFYLKLKVHNENTTSDQIKALLSLTQNTRLIRLAIRVNRTNNRTNRGLIPVTFRPFECIRESRV